MKCAKCKHRTDSKYHQVHCLGRRGAQIKRRSSAGRSSGGRGHSAAASIISFSYAASGPIASASFFEDRAPQAVQS
jgi:hypothetical protein